MLLVASHHIMNLWRLSPSLRGTVGKVPMVLGPLQTQYNGVANVKTGQNIIPQLVSIPGQFDWTLMISYHLLDTWRLLQTSGGPPGRVPRVLGPLQSQSNGISDEKSRPIESVSSRTF